MKDKKKKSSTKKSEKGKLTNFLTKDTIIKILIGVGIVLLIVVLFVLSNNVGDRSNDKAVDESEVVSTENEADANPLLEDGEVLDEAKMTDEITSISLATFKKDLKKDEVTVVMLGTETCHWCISQKEILRAFLYENDVNVVYLDISTIGEDGLSYLEGLDDGLSGFGTPTFISVKGGKVTSVESGARGTSSLKTMFEKMGAM